MKKTIFAGIFLSVLAMSVSSVFANTITIKYQCLVDSIANETAIYTTIAFDKTAKNTNLKMGALNQLGYSVEVLAETLDSERAQLMFTIKEPNGAQTNLLTTTSSHLSYARAPLLIDCSSVQ